MKSVSTANSKLVSFLTLFSSTSTLLCCALPALLVSLGMGAALAGLASKVPGLIWVSEHKPEVFAFAGLMLLANGLWLWKNRNAPCPLDPKLRDACISGRKFSLRVYIVSVVIFLTGFTFAFLLA
jgi:hypothetical protein